MSEKPAPECPRCALGDHGRGPRADGIKHVATEPKPTLEQMEFWLLDGVGEATDGCRVENDGRCEHGHTAWMRLVGIV